MTKGSIHQVDKTTANIYAPNIRQPKHTKQKLKANRAKRRNKQQYHNNWGL